MLAAPTISLPMVLKSVASTHSKKEYCIILYIVNWKKQKRNAFKLKKNCSSKKKMTVQTKKTRTVQQAHVDIVAVTSKSLLLGAVVLLLPGRAEAFSKRKHFRETQGVREGGIFGRKPQI